MKPVARTICNAALSVLLFAAAATSRAGDLPEPPKLRLPAVARPLAYAVELTIDPSQERFSGSISIDISLAKAVSLLWLNATELDVESATASHDGTSLGLRIVPGGNDFVGFAFEQPVGPGRITLSIQYHGALRRESTQGLFKQEDRGQHYVFSQFEATDARKAFPCFDEPSYKAPWLVTLRIPASVTAVSNSPVLSESVDAGGQKTVRFGRTPPLPSYLVAFCVGPFEFVDAGRWGARKTPIRIVVPRGRTKEARWAAETTGPVVKRLEGYFGTPFPFEKLDVLAIPQTVTWGAMENAGLITMSASLLLASGAEDTFFFRRTSVRIGAHELAHQWFGDLVTLAWWDDIWLNESFAEWVSQKLVRAWKPEWKLNERETAVKSYTMQNDALASARQIRQPIESRDDILNMFDAITYTKGSAVLEMFETWLGEKRFQAGVRRYLKGSRWGNATSSDFLRALDAESARGSAEALQTFLDQSGVPLIRIGIDCQSGRSPRILLSQKRFVPAWSGASEPRLWRVPVCLRVRAGGKVERVCHLLAREAESFDLPKRPCPDLVVAHIDGTGYYHASYAEGLFGSLVEAAAGTMSGVERAVFVNDTELLAAGGAVPMKVGLELVSRFAGDPSAYVLLGLFNRLRDLRDGLIPVDLQPSYARFLRAFYGERARAVGFAPRTGESDETRFLRFAGLVDLVATDGEDAALRGEARRLAEGWIADRTSLDADVSELALDATAESGDRVFFQSCRAAAKSAAEPRDRRRLVGALGLFRDPALARDAVALLVSGEIGPLDARSFLSFCGYSNEFCRNALWDAVRSGFDDVIRRLPPEATGDLPSYFGFCSEERRREVEAFFRPRVEKLPGGPRNLDQTVESIGLCAARKAAQEPDIRAFFEKY